ENHHQTRSLKQKLKKKGPRGQGTEGLRADQKRNSERGTPSQPYRPRHGPPSIPHPPFAIRHSISLDPLPLPWSLAARGHGTRPVLNCHYFQLHPRPGAILLAPASCHFEVS